METRVAALLSGGFQQGRPRVLRRLPEALAHPVPELAHRAQRPRHDRHRRHRLRHGGLLRTSTRPTLNLFLLLLLRATICAFTLKVRHASTSVRVLVLNDPPIRQDAGFRLARPHADLGRGVIETKHSTDVASLRPLPRVCMSIHVKVSHAPISVERLFTMTLVVGTVAGEARAAGVPDAGAHAGAGAADGARLRGGGRQVRRALRLHLRQAAATLTFRKPW